MHLPMRQAAAYLAVQLAVANHTSVAMPKLHS